MIYLIWDTNDIQDKRIVNTIKGFKSEADILEAWSIRIKKIVKFPFKAEIVEPQDFRSIVQQGDVLRVHYIEEIDDKYGVIANTRFGRKKVYFPLCALESLDSDDKGQKIIDDYAVWFANQ